MLIPDGRLRVLKGRHLVLVSVSYSLRPVLGRCYRVALIRWYRLGVGSSDRWSFFLVRLVSEWWKNRVRDWVPLLNVVLVSDKFRYVPHQSHSQIVYRFNFKWNGIK